MYMCIYIYIYSICIIYIYIYIYTHVSLCLSLSIYIYIHMYIYIYIYTHVTYVCIHIYIYAYICIQIHRCIYTNIHNRSPGGDRVVPLTSPSGWAHGPGRTNIHVLTRQIPKHLRICLPSSLFVAGICWMSSNTPNSMPDIFPIVARSSNELPDIITNGTPDMVSSGQLFAGW